MERWAIVNSDDNVVDNLVVWDGTTPWTPPDGHSAIALAGQWCDIGYTYDSATGLFSPPVPE
jgi:hypothetical protein